jgi:hypothetical protein
MYYLQIQKEVIMDDVSTMHSLHGKDMELAQAYVRSQHFGAVFPPEEGLCKGTAFPCLSQPYMGWIKIPVCE